MKPNPQRFSWKVVGKHNTYQEAKEHFNTLNTTNKKIHRMGPRRVIYAVKVGTKIKKAQEEETQA